MKSGPTNTCLCYECLQIANGVVRLTYKDDQKILVGAENDKRKTSWVLWNIMLRPKNYWGVGFRDMRILNQTLLDR